MAEEAKQLTLTQQIALAKVYEEVDLARRNLRRAQDRFDRVLIECGLQVGVDYDVSPDGVVTQQGREIPAIESEAP